MTERAVTEHDKHGDRHGLGRCVCSTCQKEQKIEADEWEIGPPNLTPMSSKDVAVALLLILMSVVLGTIFYFAFM